VLIRLSAVKPIPGLDLVAPLPPMVDARPGCAVKVHNVSILPVFPHLVGFSKPSVNRLGLGVILVDVIRLLFVSFSLATGLPGSGK
jgi:hypothetical protein